MLLRRDNLHAEKVQCIFILVRVIIDELKMSDTSDIIQTELQADDSDGDRTHEEENGIRTKQLSSST